MAHHEGRLPHLPAELPLETAIGGTGQDAHDACARLAANKARRAALELPVLQTGSPAIKIPSGERVVSAHAHHHLWRYLYESLGNLLSPTLLIALRLGKRSGHNRER